MTDGPGSKVGLAQGVTSLGVHNQIDHKNRPAKKTITITRTSTNERGKRCRVFGKVAEYFLT